MSVISILAESSVEAKKVFPAFDPQWVLPQLFWLAIFFTLLYIGLSRFILPRLADTIEKRGDSIASDLDQAAKLNDQAEEAQKALELRIAEARSGARETANQARSKMDAEIAAETARIDGELDKRLSESEARLTAQRAEAMSKVEGIAVGAAMAMTQKFGISPDAAKVEAAVNSATGTKG